jgi:NADPH-dependent curcumin reductase CurA
MAGGGEDAAAARNKMVVLKRHVTGFPTEKDMEVVVSTVRLRVPAGSTSAVLVKNLYLSCDPWMRGRMSKHDEGVTVPAPDFVVGQVRLQNPYTVLLNVIGALGSDMKTSACG